MCFRDPADCGASCCCSICCIRPFPPSWETDSRKWHGTLRELYADKGDTPEMIERYYALLTAPDPALS